LECSVIRLETRITLVRTSCHFARFTPDSDFFHHTFCTVRTVHSVCSPFTLEVNPLLTTIAHHIFSSVLRSLPSAVARASYQLTWIHLHLCLIPSIKQLQLEAHPPRMSWPTTIAPSEQIAPQRTMSAPASKGATDEVAIEVDGDDSPLSSASPEVVRLPRWDGPTP